jgi:DNA-directed RNA polymerase specialized sigma24 family protein
MSQLLPTTQLIEIAKNCVKKYCTRNSPDIEDFRQEVLLGILERQASYNPALGTAKRFVITVAQQIAKRCRDEHCRHQQLKTRNHRTQLLIPINAIDTDDADEFGLLFVEDNMLNLIRFTVFLSQEELTVLNLRLSHCSHKQICKELRITKPRYAEIVNSLERL